MLSYRLKCRKNTKSKTLKSVKTKNGRIMIKRQEANGLLFGSNLHFS